jgi:hypothetical protein
LNWIITNIKWIMLVSGVLTCSMLLVVLAPETALLLMFGVSMPLAPLTEIIVRNWGALITLTGALLIYGAYNPSNRSLILIVAAVGKTIFIVLIFLYGSQYLAKAGTTIGFDTVAVILYAAYMVGIRRHKKTT